MPSFPQYASFRARIASTLPTLARLTRFSIAPVAVLLFILLHASPSYASIGFVQASYCRASSASTVTCSYTTTVSAGDLLVADVAPTNTTASAFTVSVSDNKNGTWTSAAQCFSAYSAQANLFYFPNSASGSITVTATSSTSTSVFGLAIIEYSGIATTSPLDAGGTCSSLATGTSVTVPSVTTTNASDLVLSVLGVNGTAGTVTATSPYTLRNNASEAFADQIVSSAGTYTGTTFSWTYSNDTFGIAAAFKGVSSGGTVATPTSSPAAGSYGSPQTISLSDSTSGATICYTTDGTTPAATTPGTCSHGTTYSSSFLVSTTTTVKAIGTHSGDTNSSVLTSVYTITSTAGAAVLCPNVGEVGDYANCEPSPVLAFGNQGKSTSSMAIPISINNCQNSYISACNGGTASITISSIALSGTNASDFTVSGCGAGTVVTAGNYCSPTITFKPTATSGTNETATLTVTDNASTSTQTMSLTGTSATVTTLSSSSCPSNLSTGNYQLSANISCGGTAFTYDTNIDVNLNGHTITYGTASQSTQIGAFLLTASNNAGLVVHNGTITEGTGINTYSPDGVQPLSSLVGYEGNSQSGPGNGFFNLTLSINMQYANVLALQSNFIAHDNVITDTGVGTCASASCREDLQSSTIYQNGAKVDPSGGTAYYNNTQTGGPQGGFVVDDPGATITYNYINPGNPTGTNTNNFAIWCWANNCTAEHNIITLPVTSSSANRGVQISDAELLGGGGRTVAYNYIAAIDLPVNSEYGSPGCSLSGTFGLQFDDNPTGANTANNNTVVATASAGGCPATGLRVSDSEVTTNQSEDNQYAAVRATGAPACTNGTWTDMKSGCAFGIGLDGPIGFTSTDDTFTGDSGCIFVGPLGATGVTLQSPTCIKGSNPSNFHTIVAQNGPTGGGGGGAVNVSIIDATFGTGTGPTDTVIYAQGANTGPASFYIDWTQSMTVKMASGPDANGATVTFTDTLGNHYSCTTNASGVCSVAVTQYRDNNDAGANQVENRNPFSLSVALSGCTTYTQTGITISTTTPRTITLSGC